jgi:hypothetical protein
MRWNDSVFVVYDETMSSLSGVHPIPFPQTAEDNPAFAFATPRRITDGGLLQRQAASRREAIQDSIATPRGKQWLELSRCETCFESSFAGSFTGLGERNEQPGFTLLSSSGMCYHFAAETFAERSRWVKLLSDALRALGPQSPTTVERLMPGFFNPKLDLPSKKTGKIFSLESLTLSAAISARAETEGESGNKSPDSTRSTEEDGEGKAHGHDAVECEPALIGSTHTDTIQLNLKAKEELIKARNAICLEREVNRRLERKIRVLEKGLVAVREESEGLRAALMAALDRLAMFSSNSVPVTGIVAKSSSNWLEFDSNEQEMEKTILDLMCKVEKLETTLRIAPDEQHGDMGLAVKGAKYSLQVESGMDTGERLRGEELQRQVDELQKQVHQLTLNLDAAQARTQSVEKELTGSKEEVEAARLQLQDALSRSRLLQAQLLATNEDNRLHVDALESSDKETETLKEQLLAAYKQVEECKTELEDKRKTAEASSLKCRDLEDTFKTKQMVFEAMKSELAALQGQSKALEAELLGCRRDLKACQDSLKDKEVELKNRTAQVVQLKSEVATSSSSLITSQAELKEALLKLQRLQGDSSAPLNGKASTISVQIQLNEAKKLEDTLRQQLSKAQTDEKAATASLQRAHVKHEQSVREVEELRSELGALKAQLIHASSSGAKDDEVNFVSSTSGAHFVCLQTFTA